MIKDRLDETGPVRTAPTAAGSDGLDSGGHPGARADEVDAGTERQNALTAVALDDRPAPERVAPQPPAGGAGRPRRAASRPRPDGCPTSPT